MYVFANVICMTIRLHCPRCDTIYTYTVTYHVTCILEYASSTLFSFPEDGTRPKYWNIDGNELGDEFGCSFRQRRVVL